MLTGTARLVELDAHWSLDDMADAHEALDIQDELQERMIEKMKVQR